MRHIFIINPAAGTGKDGDRRKLRDEIKSVSGRLGVTAEIHDTECSGDAAHIVRELCKKYDGEELRFYACGGDGTLGEVASGALGQKNVEITVIPCGTGNDFVRNFNGADAFSDIEAHLRGSAMSVDALVTGDKAAVNFVNMGFDCAVVERTALIKRHPLVTPKFAYIAGVITEFVKMPCIKIKKLLIDGKEHTAGKLLLLAAAGGGFYGGGFNAAPEARLDDGLIDVCLAYPMSRVAFVSMVGGYQNGSYINNKRTLKHISLCKCRCLDIYFDGEQSVCFDGEIERVSELHIELKPLALRFSIPFGASCKNSEKMKKESGNG